MKPKIIITILVLILITLIACTTHPIAPPEILVTSEGQAVDTITNPTQWISGDTTEIGDFTLFFSDASDLDVLYLKLDVEIEIEFPEGQPDSYNMTDRFIREDGNYKYDDKVTQIVDIEFVDDVGLFILDRNLSFSSHFKDYEPEATLRGFRLTCHFGDNVCEYLFVIRTDG